MKKLLIALLALTLLMTGCVPMNGDDKATPAPTAIATEPAATELPELPYKDSRAKYTYIMTGERDRKWEEDIVYFANEFLDPYHGHPLLSDRTVVTRIYNDLLLQYAQQGSENFFDPELKERFIAKINELILSVPESSDTDIIAGIAEAQAMLDDIHSYMSGDSYALYFDRYLPYCFETVYTDEGPAYLLGRAPEEHSGLLGASLTAVNGIPVEEVFERLAPCIPKENEEGFRDMVQRLSYLRNCGLLRHYGIMREGNSVKLSFTALDGTEQTIEATSRVRDENFWDGSVIYESEDLNEYGETGISFPYMNDADVWYNVICDGSALYLRIMSCMVDETLDAVMSEAFAAAEAAGDIKKVLVDFRGNIGGYPDLYGNYIRIAKYLEKAVSEGDEVYILIDGGCYSASVGLPAMLRRRIEGAKLVGSPTGQSVRFFVGQGFTLPNCRLFCNCSSAYFDFWPDYEGDALMPDIVIRQTYEDYLSGFDTVLHTLLTPQD